MKTSILHLLPAMLLAALACAGGCNRNTDSTEEPEPAAEPGAWRPGELARVAVTEEDTFRVQQETAAKAEEVPALLRKAGATTAEPIVIDAPANIGPEPVVALQAALRKAGFAMTRRQMGHVEAPAGETFEAPFIRWAQGGGFDTTDAPVVVTGRVEAIDCLRGPDEGPGQTVGDERVVIRLHEILRADRKAAGNIPDDKWLDPATHKWLVTGGAEGLWPGDTVVVLLSEYDGALAVLPRRGGDCRLGAKLSGWDDPTLESVRYALAEGMEKAMAHPVHSPLLRHIGAEAVEEMEPWE